MTTDIDAATAEAATLPTLLEVGQKQGRGERLNRMDVAALMNDGFNKRVWPLLRRGDFKEAMVAAFHLLGAEIAVARELRLELEDRVAALEKQTAKPAKKRPPR